jgi:hypothetical protein
MALGHSRRQCAVEIARDSGQPVNEELIRNLITRRTSAPRAELLPFLIAYIQSSEAAVTKTGRTEANAGSPSGTSSSVAALVEYQGVSSSPEDTRTTQEGLLARAREAAIVAMEGLAERVTPTTGWAQAMQVAVDAVARFSSTDPSVTARQPDLEAVPDPHQTVSLHRRGR